METSASGAARVRSWAVAIALVAFLLRLVHVWQLRDHPWFADPQVDALFHHDWALAVARGEPFVEGPYFRAPLYAWFLGGLYSLFGPDPVAVRVVQALFGSASCVIVFLLGRSLFSDRVGRAAGLVCAAYWPLIYFDGELLIPPLGIFLNLAALLGMVRAAESDRPRAWLLAGGLSGLAALARPNILLFAAVATLWILVRHGRRRLAWKSTTTWILGCALPILPVTARNAIVGDDLVLISSQAGVNLHIGNNPEADGISVVGEFASWYETQHREAELAEGRPLRPSEVSQHFAGRALEFWREQPGDALALFGRKLLWFWTWWELSNNQNPRFVAERYTPVAKLLPVGFWLIGPLGLVGWIFAARRAREQFPLWGFVPVYMLSVAIFFVNARFRLPVVPVLAIYAGAGAFAFVDAVRARHLRTVAAALVALVPAIWMTSRVPPTADTELIGAHRVMGLFAYGQGDNEEARELLGEAARRARALDLDLDPIGLSVLGRTRLALGDPSGAREAFERAVASDPRNPDAHMGLAVLATGAGDDVEALRHATAAVRDARWVPQTLVLARNAWTIASRNSPRSIATRWLGTPTWP